MLLLCYNELLHEQIIIYDKKQITPIKVTIFVYILVSFSVFLEK